MTSVSNGGDPRHRRRLETRIKDDLRRVHAQLGLLNRQVGARLRIKDADLECLDLIAAHGPIAPKELAGRAGIHPATLTGILDRLETAGWIVRERAADDRRSVAVRTRPERLAEIYGQFAGMNDAMDELCAEYSPAELELLAGFLERVGRAGQMATAALAR
ncbi:MarR family winged helix-turn-helix transcriptional regulator [Nocardia stercoris]|uniref:MarR family transcriptional regulator n=1 Tax=Nocardia stercoris TaxID=2483361 RepID=A0A3M2L402_9NOCA|nr:MarR family transcriptional regulator [Nocardia stercoris]RMI31440.1 MarR family transcriptional regulator [Nocardia stercoris]